MARYDADTAIGGPSRNFPDTRDSLIVAATGAPEALGDVIDVYWKPTYKYIRWKWNRSNEESKDLVQGFFAALIEREILAGFDPSLGSFRGYLRGCLDNFVLKQDESAHRLKRGGALELVPLDFETAERELSLIPPPDTPEDLFHREWQRRIFALAIEDLRALCLRTGRETQFAIFESHDLAPEARPGYEDLAAEYRVTIATVTNYLAWARRELRRLALERAASVRGGVRELFG